MPGLGGDRRFWTMDRGTRPGHQFGLHFDGQMTADLWSRDLQWILKICANRAKVKSQKVKAA